MRTPSFRLRVIFACAFIALAIFAVRAADEAFQRKERLARHRSLGKALYETPTTLSESVLEFQRALELAPDSAPDHLNLGLALLRSGRADEGIAELEHAQKMEPAIPHTWFNLGIAYRKVGRLSDAIRQMERFVQLVPDDAVGQHNLGVFYNLDDRPDLAMRQFRTANRLDPRLVAPYSQIYTLHRLAEREQQATAALAALREAKKGQEATGESEDIEWNAYAEIYEVIEAQPPASPPVPVVVRDFKLSGRADPGTAGLLVLDFDGDRKPDFLVWSRSGLLLYRNGHELVKTFGLEDARDVINLAAGDFDNDGLTDLCLVTDSGVSLYRNTGRQFRHAQSASGDFDVALWIDYDHDNDLDLVVPGRQSFVLRNEGAGGFAKRSDEFPFVIGRALSATVIRTVSDTKGLDVAVSYTDRGGVLYRDQLRGRFEAEPLTSVRPGTRSLLAVDANNDGWVDIAFGGGIVLNRKGTLAESALPLASASVVAFADLARNGFATLICGGQLFRPNAHTGFDAVAAPAAFKDAVALASADFDGDGKIDVAKIDRNGNPHLLVNETVSKGGWLSVSLEGMKAAKQAAGAEVEIKAGAMYQKRFYDGLPLFFGVGSYREIDTVRITWPGGMIQNEVRQPVGRAAFYKEAPRLSGSCPMIFTWNGREFEFITDVLGVAPLGASSGGDRFFPVDHDEYIRIPAEALVPNHNGQFDVRITEELKEVSYLDKVQLIAVDHAKDTEILTNDQFQPPPFRAFGLFGIRNRKYPARATDGHDHDVRSSLLRKDRVYPDDFLRDHAGVAETHTLTLDFGRDAAARNQAVLVLNGWTDWADGSTFRRASQEPGGGLRFPQLQVRDQAGRWRTVIEEMGIPAGKPKTIVVDLKGKFPSGSREVRIVTNLCVYWDEIFLADDVGARETRLLPLDAQSAQLRFRGFSRATIHPERKQPEWFDYSRVTTTSLWKPTPGLYTKYGETADLVREVDDRYVIMGSGDELQLSYDSTRLPPIATGFVRDFLLLVDGWAKDADANTAFGGTVEPLPFHSMSRYPFLPPEAYPTDAFHDSYRATFNTRRPMPLVRPLHRRP